MVKYVTISMVCLVGCAGEPAVVNGEGIPDNATTTTAKVTTLRVECDQSFVREQSGYFVRERYSIVRPEGASRTSGHRYIVSKCNREYADNVETEHQFLLPPEFHCPSTSTSCTNQPQATDICEQSTPHIIDGAALVHCATEGASGHYVGYQDIYITIIAP